MDRILRARVLIAEAEALGVSLDDLLAAAATTLPDRSAPVPTVAQYLAVIRPPSRRAPSRPTTPTGASPSRRSVTGRSTP
jgi:hypothetical protein